MKNDEREIFKLAKTNSSTDTEQNAANCFRIFLLHNDDEGNLEMTMMQR